MFVVNYTQDMRVFARGLIALTLTGLCGCSTPESRVSDAPLNDLKNPELPDEVRRAAADRARSEADAESLPAVRSTFKDVAWSQSEPVAVRLSVLTAMANDADPAVVAELREMGKLMLPREQQPAIVTYLSTASADRGWTDYVPPLIRSFSRSIPALDQKGVARPEAVAIERLSGGKPVEDVVFGVFLNPPQMPDSYGMDWSKRFRRDAWELLGRLDTDGSKRLALLESGQNSVESNPELDAVRRCVRELRAIPLTGEELNWVLSLQDGKRADNAAWWTEAASVIASLPQHGPLSVRHAEPIRWASVNHPAWLTATREELLVELRGRLKDRQAVLRQIGNLAAKKETLETNEGALRWGDVLALLVIDENVRQDFVISGFFSQVGLDRKDETTEYGGIFTMAKNASFVPVMYPPRPGQRQGDNKFVASEDMLKASDRALAHYHFHVQQAANRAYAGPSDGDLVYAARYGRQCLVLTSISETELNVDYYQPDGTVVDLGIITKGGR